MNVYPHDPGNDAPYVHVVELNDDELAVLLAALRVVSEATDPDVQELSTLNDMLATGDQYVEWLADTESKED